MTGNQLERRRFAGGSLRILRSAAAGHISRRKAAQCALRAILGLCLGRARLFGGLSPFGAAMAAAAGCGVTGLSTLAGILCGYLTGGLRWGVKYAIASILIYVARSIAQDTAAAKKPWFPSLCSGGVFGCVSFAAMYAQSFSSHALAAFCGETALCALFAYLFPHALLFWSEEPEPGDLTRTVSTFCLAAAAIADLVPILPLGVFSIGRIAMSLCVMLTAFRGGVPIACASGLIFGAVGDIASGGTAYFTIVYGISAAAAGLLSKKRRIAFDLLYILSAALCVMWLSPSLLTGPALYETFVASVLFLALPPRLSARITALFPEAPVGYGALRARAYTRLRVERTAAAFHTLYRTLADTPAEEQEDTGISCVFDRASDRVCAGCAQSHRCWEQEYGRTLEVMNGLEAVLHRRGILKPGDAPVSFAKTCEHLELLTRTLNLEYQGLQRQRLYRSRLRRRQDAAYRQYRETALVLDGIAAELGSGMTFEPTVERRLHKHLRSMGLDFAAAAFRDSRGRLHVELAGEGMFTLRREEDYLRRLSAAAGTALCAVTAGTGPRSMTLRQCPFLRASVRTAGSCRDGQTVSGDRVLSFETEEGIFCALLSDGMGVGEGAARCSWDTVSVLEGFLRAGVGAEASLSLLCDLMLLENEASTVCATVDLLTVDLFTGEGMLYKLGAAPTYLCREQTVRRLKSRIPAVGLAACEDAPSRGVALHLEPGTRVVLVTDGILGSGDDGWLRELLPDLDPDSGAQEILSIARNRSGCGDDMTVLTVSLEPCGDTP